ncbi:R3H domain-containing protein 4-like isoform X2 [Rhopilema esculentum]|uniref:R3H domain-containing protein 4-like isoform X2 n=1 Tax=Rhopilema esculentum TaxID=499914 RepID=UPI0031E23D56
MGVLDIPAHRRLIREAIAFDNSHVEEYHSDENIEQHAAANGRPRRQRTPKLGRKVFGSHEVKRGNGVRRQRRNENLFFLYSLVDGVDPDELQDEDDMRMTAFGELFADPTKMRAWAEFMVMTEEDQISFLDASNKSRSNRNNDDGTEESHLEKDFEWENQNFVKINKNIRDFLRSEDLSKESLAEYEEDLITSFFESAFDVLVLDVPSSFDRMMIHGLCQYMQLQASTSFLAHKFKKKRLMEIENQASPLTLPSQLLSSYLNTIHK